MKQLTSCETPKKASATSPLKTLVSTHALYNPSIRGGGGGGDGGDGGGGLGIGGGGGGNIVGGFEAVIPVALIAVVPSLGVEEGLLDRMLVSMPLTVASGSFTGELGRPMKGVFVEVGMDGSDDWLATGAARTLTGLRMLPVAGVAAGTVVGLVDAGTAADGLFCCTMACTMLPVELPVGDAKTGAGVDLGAGITACNSEGMAVHFCACWRIALILRQVQVNTVKQE